MVYKETLQSTKTHVLGALKKRLNETFLLGTYNTVELKIILLCVGVGEGEFIYHLMTNSIRFELPIIRSKTYNAGRVELTRFEYTCTYIRSRYTVSYCLVSH